MSTSTEARRGIHIPLPEFHKPHLPKLNLHLPTLKGHRRLKSAVVGLGLIQLGITSQFVAPIQEGELFVAYAAQHGIRSAASGAFQLAADGFRKGSETFYWVRDRLNPGELTVPTLPRR